MDQFMKEALREARAGAAEGGIPIGAALVDADNRLVATGPNRRVQDRACVMHAEINCLLGTGKTLDNFRGMTMYSTLMPCNMCAGAIVQFGIARIVAGESQNFREANGLDLMSRHGFEVIDLDLDEARELVREWNRDIGNRTPGSQTGGSFSWPDRTDQNQLDPRISAAGSPTTQPRSKIEQPTTLNTPPLPHRKLSLRRREERLRPPRPENTRPVPALRPGEKSPPEREKESAMETNGVNGHQHEASEKRLAPGTFPCRLDMELCACGAKRWVNLQSRPATPWQFINLRARPRGQEGATKEPGTPPKSVLEGLITCGSCGQPMAPDGAQGGQEARYACRPGPGQSRCPTPRLHARSAETLLVRAVLQTVLTEENISRVPAVANDPQRYDEARKHSLTRKDLKEVRENPGRFVPAAGGAPRTRDFLSGFITGIQVQPETAVIYYSIPLPEDSPLAGMHRQEIDLPEEVLARWTTPGTCPPPMAIHGRNPRYLQRPRTSGQ